MYTESIALCCILPVCNKQEKKEITKFIHEFLYVDENSAYSIYGYMREQFLYAKMPTDQRILVEHYTGFGKKKYLIFHTMFGRRTNDALSRAIAYLASRRTGRDVMISLTDNGFYLLEGEKRIDHVQPLEDLKRLSLREILIKAIDKTEILARRFRHCATRSLMILRTYKGQRKSVGKQQIGSKLLLNFIKKLPGEFPILKEARREVLEDLMDAEHAGQIVALMRDGRIKVEAIETVIPTPFALNMIAQGYMDVLRTEERMEFIKRMHQAVLMKIAGK